MGNRYSRLPFVLVASLVIACIVGCDTDYPPSVYDPDEQFEPDPVISAMIPADSTLAGIGEITIQGQNFSSVPEENFVYFDDVSATVVSASETELKIQSPNLPGDSIQVKVAVHGAILFSNVMYYKLMTAIWEVGELTDYDDAYGLACDKDENIYISLTPKRVIKVTPEGTVEEYASTLFDKASAMKVGPEGYIYYVNILQYMARIPPGGGADELFGVLPGGAFDLDFDADDNIYCGGSGKAIYRVKSDASSATVADYPDINIRAVRVFNGYVYVAGKYTGTDVNQVQQGIWRNQIVSGDADLGETELVFDWGSAYPNDDILSITFSEDGDLFVGTDAPEAIIIIRQDGSREPLYPGVLVPSSYYLCWGNGKYLYVNRRESSETKRVLKINVQEEGAPYYGRL